MADITGGEDDIGLPYKRPTFDDWNNIATFYHPLMAGSIDGTDTEAHDRAVIRASRSKYTPNKRVKGNPAKTVMIRHLTRHTKEVTLKRIFSEFGELVECRVVRDIITGISKGYAFIEYEHESEARRAIRESKELLIDESKVTVDFECGRTLPGWIPRRFGGGFGGKKESGQLRFGGVERQFRRPIPLNSNPLGVKNRNENMKRDFRQTRDNSSKDCFSARKHFKTR